MACEWGSANQAKWVTHVYAAAFHAKFKSSELKQWLVFFHFFSYWNCLEYSYVKLVQSNSRIKSLVCDWQTATGTMKGWTAEMTPVSLPNHPQNDC